MNIASVVDKPLKFLGSEVTSENTQSAMFALINKKLNEKLENIDKSSLRGEYKLNIYTRFALPSMRYYFSVHQLHQTHMNQLDNSVKKYVKKWLDIQTRGVSDAAIFHPYLLGVKKTSQMYKEAHADQN